MGLEEVTRLGPKLKGKRVLVQLPAGLMPKADEIRGLLKDCVVFFSAHPCFGGCDVDVWEAKLVGADAVINFGHSPTADQTDVPVYFVEWRQEIQLDFRPDGLPKRIGLVTTVQFVDQLKGLERKLEDAGHQVLVGMPGPRCKYLGQVTGCDVASALAIADEVDGFIFLGQSRFHSMKVAVETQKPVWMLTETGGLVKLNDEEVKREVRKKLMRKQRALTHKSYGILVSTKPGQFDLHVAEQLKKQLEGKGKTAIILVGNIFRADEIGNYIVDAFVSTACPRLVDDYEVYGKPIYSVEDF